LECWWKNKARWSKVSFSERIEREWIIEIKSISTHENCSDILTKNIPVKLYNKHSKSFCVDDDDPEITLWESVKSIKNKSVFDVSRLILDDVMMT
jgi:hypothetical protein